MRLASGVVKIGVATGGSGYGSAPAVSIAGGGGTGATAVAVLNGTAVQAVVIGNAGTGYTSSPTVTLSGGGGTGAAATAAVLSYSGTPPLSMFKGRFNDLYGVDGNGRGFRWDGDTPILEPLGISKPENMVAPVKGATGDGYVSAVQLLEGGAGYNSPPTVTFTGGGATQQATGVAILTDGRVSSVRLTGRGAGYTGPPQIAFSGGQGSSAAFTVNCLGQLGDLTLTAFGDGYTGAPDVLFSAAQGLTNAAALVSVDTSLERAVAISVAAAGTGATTTGLTVSLTGGGATTQAQVNASMLFSVASITVANSGQGYMSPPVVVLQPDPADPFGGGALAQCSVNSTGNITGVTVLSGGQYTLPPTAVIPDTSARAVATVPQRLKGVYQCCIRYLDDTPELQGGPIPSSISELVEVDCSEGVGSLTWKFNHHGMESRVHAIELWRTTADQQVVLYRVARIDKVGGVVPSTDYIDSLSDLELLDPARDTTASNVTSKYGFMPVVLPSGARNARRFDPPPTQFSVACMFQDRAWYAVNADQPNSLYYSEVDEPESVPDSNELIVQENAGDSDAIVALVPFGASLLIAQARHLYRLSYVAQPVIDATISLVSYRGVLNSRCWDVFAGVAFLADDYGVYAFDGTREEAISAPIDNYWRDGIIDFSKAAACYLRVDANERVVRFFYCRAGDGAYPPRALCYSIATQAWWEEVYSQALPHAAVCPTGGRQRVLYGGEVGGVLKSAGFTDATTAGGTTAVDYSLRTTPMRLAGDTSRSVELLYTPTSASNTLSLGLHYNNSSSPRPNAIVSDRGEGFVAAGTFATLDLSQSRSPLGPATGRAKARYAGRSDDRSAGADRHLAIGLSGSQDTESVVLHAVTVEGVG